MQTRMEGEIRGWMTVLGGENGERHLEELLNVVERASAHRESVVPSPVVHDSVYFTMQVGAVQPVSLPEGALPLEPRTANLAGCNPSPEESTDEEANTVLSELRGKGHLRKCRTCDGMFDSRGEHLCATCVGNPIPCDWCHKYKAFAEYGTSRKTTVTASTRQYIARRCTRCITKLNSNKRRAAGENKRGECAKCKRNFAVVIKAQPFCEECIEAGSLPAVTRCRRCGYWQEGECACGKVSGRKRTAKAQP